MRATPVQLVDLRQTEFETVPSRSLGHKRSFDIAQLSDALATRFTLVKVSKRFFIDWDSVGVWRKLQGLVKKLLSWKGIGTYGICRNIFFVVKKTWENVKGRL